jgi:hypothetical protein
VLDSYEQGWRIDELRPGVYTWDVRVPSQNLRPGAYSLNVSITAKHVGNQLYFAYMAGSFMVEQDSQRFLYADPNAIFHLQAGFSVKSDFGAAGAL